MCKKLCNILDIVAKGYFEARLEFRLKKNSKAVALDGKLNLTPFWFE